MSNFTEVILKKNMQHYEGKILNLETLLIVEGYLAEYIAYPSRNSLMP